MGLNLDALPESIISEEQIFTGAEVQLEQAIAERLAPIKDLGIHVLVLPNTTADLEQPLPRGSVCIHYDRSRIEKPTATHHQITQNEDQVFFLTITSPTIRGRQTALITMRVCQLLLTGHKFPGARGRAYWLQKGINEIRLKQGTWQYVMELAIPTLIIGNIDLESYGLLRTLQILKKQDDSVFVSVEETHPNDPDENP